MKLSPMPASRVGRLEQRKFHDPRRRRRLHRLYFGKTATDPRKKP